MRVLRIFFLMFVVLNVGNGVAQHTKINATSNLSFSRMHVIHNVGLELDIKKVRVGLNFGYDAWHALRLSNFSPQFGTSLYRQLIGSEKMSVLSGIYSRHVFFRVDPDASSWFSSSGFGYTLNYGGRVQFAQNISAGLGLQHSQAGFSNSVYLDFQILFGFRYRLYEL